MSTAKILNRAGWRVEASLLRDDEVQALVLLRPKDLDCLPALLVDPRCTSGGIVPGYWLLDCDAEVPSYRHIVPTDGTGDITP